MSPFVLVSLRRTVLTAVTIFLLAIPGPKDNASNALVAAAPAGRTQPVLANLPLSFEPNSGQVDPRVKFLSRGRGYTLFLTKDQAILELQQPGVRSQESEYENVRAGAVPRWHEKTGNGVRPTFRIEKRKAKSGSAIVHLRLVGAKPDAEVTGRDELPGTDA